MMNARQLWKISRKIFLLEHLISKEYAHDNNKKKLKQYETNLAIWFRLLCETAD